VLLHQLSHFGGLCVKKSGISAYILTNNLETMPTAVLLCVVLLLSAANVGSWSPTNTGFVKLMLWLKMLTEGTASNNKSYIYNATHREDTANSAL
jgi:hypothetical protein